MLEIKPSFCVLDIYEVVFVWRDGSVIHSSKLSEKLIPEQMNLDHPTDPATK